MQPDRDDANLPTLSCLLDREGAVVHCEAGPAGAISVVDLALDIDVEGFQALCAAVEAAVNGVLQFEARTPGSAEGRTMLRLTRVDGVAPRYLLQALDGDQDAAGYRGRLEQRLEFERLIAMLSTELIHAPADRLDVLIESALGQIGRLFSVDRAYLFRYNDERSYQSNTHEWVEEGISREAELLQAIPINHFPWLRAELLAGHEVHVPVVEELAEVAAAEKAEFMREGIRSLALVPFGDAGDPDGFIGFDSVRRQRHWPPEVLLGLWLVAQMFSNAFRAKEMADDLTRLAFHDPLTGLGNRRYLNERLAYVLEQSRRETTQLAVILIDLDDFKLVNDSFGHSIGDEVLRTVASRVVATLRGADIVARLGGDEFVVVVPMASAQTLAPLVARLFDAMQEPVALEGTDFMMRMSVGIALYPDDGESTETLLRQADTAMYSAKAEGKDRFAFFTPQMTSDSREALRLRQDLQLAMARNEIRPYYQPRVALATRRVIGFEALARWHHPERGLLLPDAFLGLVVRTGLIGRIDLAMLSQAMADLATWRKFHPECRISVNLDACDLEDDALVDRLQGLLATSSEDAVGIEIEITESSLMRDIDRSCRVLSRLRDAAPRLQVAIDDFGSGYSSLACLGRLPVTTLKIDRAFIAELDNPDNTSAGGIIRSIFDLGRHLGLHVVAEGVETEAQAEVLLELGCEEAQGFLFARAVPAAEAEALLKQGFARQRNGDPADF